MCLFAVSQQLPAFKLSKAVEGKNRRQGLAHGLTLVTLRRKGEYRLAVKTPWGIMDVKETAKLLRMYSPSTMDDLLQNEDGPSLNELVNVASKSSAVQRTFFQEDDLEYGPVVTRPEKIICVDMNYRKYLAEAAHPLPKEPALFNKYNNALNCHYGTIQLPLEAAKKYDYGVELVIVMGREAKKVKEVDALSYVAGYCVGNDFCARDKLEMGGPWMMGKTVDQFAPIGPYLITADQINPDNLMLECRVNGQTCQSSHTRDLIFNSSQIISYISRYITLKPGDIIFTGTPEGVIQNKPKDRQNWLKPGDKIACSVEKLGELVFHLV